ncbi:hypothetical protein N7532_009178 [Penicillium argentinense]|uniref:Zn(2)-C6 fungal-type domain-containing protein n=1 Tax=Penicillium argentinense TaxID=1131581 RepID=A0A9W9K2A0_9EURO|nr:uncharacterized protein N7532_009178 [Penicillium argentinense]KAJ5090494.1 hypothetical protein N7532_009178 [Penicillium argentinense]
MPTPQESKLAPKGRRNVKTGCKTCKTRRVKCDEKKPACHRCLSTGRVCDGYGIWGGGGTPYSAYSSTTTTTRPGSAGITQPHTTKSLSIYNTPVPTGSLTNEEQSSFDWFMRKTSTKFAGLFTSQFWEMLIFQASAQEPAVRHAVVALSAAHRADLARALPAMYTAGAGMEEIFILSQYNKAIRHLRLVKAATSSKAIRVALITCMLFVTLEYLRGQYQMGSAHLRYGIQLLSSISSPQSAVDSDVLGSMTPKVLSAAEDSVHDALIESYTRLTIQSAMFGHVPAHLCMVRDPKIYSLLDAFSSPVQARQMLDNLLNRVHCFKRHIYHLEQTSDITLCLRRAQMDELISTQRGILVDLSLWRKSYNASMTLLDAEASRRDKVGFLLLKTYHEMGVIMASASLAIEKGECIFDEYTDHFVRLLSAFFESWRCWSTISLPIKELHEMIRSGNGSGSGIEHSFTIESGFIPPIYYTGLKCRVPKIRKLVMRLLKAAPHREGVWNGLLLADVLREVMRVEEKDDSQKFFREDEDEIEHFLDLNSWLNGDLKTEVPSERRIYDLKVLLPDVVGGETFMSYRMKGLGKWVSFRRKVERSPGRWSVL